jgi:hypothetical protein
VGLGIAIGVAFMAPSASSLSKNPPKGKEDGLLIRSFEGRMNNPSSFAYLVLLLADGLAELLAEARGRLVGPEMHIV